MNIYLIVDLNIDKFDVMSINDKFNRIIFRG